MLKPKDKYFSSCLLCSSIIITLAFLPSLIEGKGILMVGNDYSNQSIPFTIAIHDILRGNLSGWYWSLDLGVSAIQGFSFYNLGSPFVWFAALFPKKLIPYVMSFTYIAKYVVAASTSYCYLRRFVKNNYAAFAGSILYSFSGFQATNLLFHFHDSIAFFPLLLIGFERIKENRKDWQFFTFSIFLTAITNYFFFIQEAIFLIIYYLIRNFKKYNIKEILFYFITALFGLAMSAVLVLPSLLYIVGNQRTQSSLSLKDIIPDLYSLAYILKGYLYPADIQTDHCIIAYEQYNSTCCWLPLVSFTPALSYIFKRRDWLSFALLFFVIISFSPLCSSIFILFTQDYQRWWFMLVLLASLATAKVLDSPKDFSFKLSASINIILVALFTLFFLLSKYFCQENLLLYPKHLVIFALTSITGVFLTCIFKNNIKILTLFIALFAIGSTMWTANLYSDYISDKDAYISDINTGISLETNDPQYRYNSLVNRQSAVGNAASTMSFSSTISNSSHEFDALYLMTTNVQNYYRSTIDGISSLLAGKYNFDGTEQEACPIGFAVEGYVLKDDIIHLSRKAKANALMIAAVVDNELYDFNYVDLTNYDLNKNYISTTVENSVKEFNRNDDGFSCSSNYAENSLVYFSVPYDKGWTATIDGQVTNIIKSGGMMLIKVPKGYHNIIFQYKTPGFYTGLIITILTSTTYLFLFVYNSFKHQRKLQQIINPYT